MGFREALQEAGFAWGDPLAEATLEALARATAGEDPLRRAKAVAPLEAALAGSELPRKMVDLLGPGARIRRAFLMDKTPTDNWEIAFHQDTTLAVAEPVEVPGFHAWVHKGDWYHVQAPAEVVGQVLSTRIHLDEVPAEAGALKVLPGTHRCGIPDDAHRLGLISTVEPLTLPARRGDVLFMSPLLLHGSERARRPSQRRILHLEWSALALPGGMRWAWL